MWRFEKNVKNWSLKKTEMSYNKMIPGKIFTTKLRKLSEVDKNRKPWYLVMRFSWLLLPKFCIRKDYRTLVYVSAQFEILPIFPSLLRSLVSSSWESVWYYISSSVLFVGNHICTRMLYIYKKLLRLKIRRSALLAIKKL